MPAAGEICRGRLARPQDPARLLRLPRRQAGSDALRRFRAPDAAQRVSDALQSRGPEASCTLKHGSRLCGASLRAAPRPGHRQEATPRSCDNSCLINPSRLGCSR
ncbi:hypothetical protein XI07_24750 [Bradyrhizobium sp. CCBAU 11445]|nr:hypothetical protein [Bradyrhizobium sp. CCBAU 25360]MDA9449264.1 hypothetical protein [Bradyrhizobium sp. CCBAU 21360]MDA9455800.1 hypothetical protein [Bradyrhizobium sp. CCBAU 21359]MDA9485174.1 hypothetical protein [Bradyrhizobium sp. CCBAU 11445]MDA9516365.1 hypothetical protein [Bradyrhizobium sp. CCBAU 11430]